MGIGAFLPDPSERKPLQLMIQVCISPQDNPEGEVRDPVKALQHFAEHLNEHLPERFKGKCFNMQFFQTEGTNLSKEEVYTLNELVKASCIAGGAPGKLWK